MNKLLFLLPLIAIPILLVMTNQEGEKYSELELTGQSAILKVGEDFIEQASKEKPQEVHTLNELREITEEEIRKETQIPDLKESEKIFANGMKLSDNYNQVSFDYSTEKIGDDEYFSELLNFQIKYQKYMTAIDSYIGDDDILSLKHSLMLEYEKINQDIILLKNSGTLDEKWQSQSKYDKYKEFLPSMFEP
ncbi:hypothetical protein C6990_05145 [Nitrosopumilus sp. b3]|uniref:hypothetical protein n=1 Tax=Nitrosopumilus sp. b3 TaxID=2109909 RepID=UPI0015F5D7D6|nr:hypothetical protein [Nitrosopumilus sp. b3]KAF6247070.1 hypothetical protein C6990_05145 [Nitrosopumilus sp. b3]